jgi:hypothetical protein
MDASKMIPLQIILFCKKHWKEIVIAVAVIAAMLWFRGLINAAEKRGYATAMLEVTAARVKERDETFAEVARIKQEAAEKAEQREREVKEQAQKENEIHNADVKKRDDELARIHSLYRKAVVSNQSCADWSKIVVPFSDCGIELKSN